VLPSPAPAPGVAPSTPAPAPAPAPGSGQVVTTIGNAGKGLVDQVPPPLQPLAQPVAAAVEMLLQTCRSLPSCP
jgi:hypothetical protein